MAGMEVSAVEFPLCITFTEEGKEALGLNRPIDRVIWAENKNELERTPEGDEFCAECADELEDGEMQNFVAPQQICAMKMPSPEQVVKVLGLTTAIFEGGKRAVIAILDFIDVCTGKDGKNRSTHKLMAVKLPDGAEDMLCEENGKDRSTQKAMVVELPDGAEDMFGEENSKSIKMVA